MDLSQKPDWQRRRDTHGSVFPENLRNWLALDLVWSAQADAVVEAVEAMLRGEAPPANRFAAVVALAENEVTQDWVVEVPMTSRPLDPKLEWLLLWREADRLTIMTLYSDASFERVFWDKTLGGEPAARYATGIKKAAAETTKKLPPKK